MSITSFSNHARKHQLVSILLMAMLVASILPRVSSILQQPRRAEQQLTTDGDDVIVQGCLSEKNAGARKLSSFVPVLPGTGTASFVVRLPACVKHPSYSSASTFVSHLVYTLTTASHL